MKARSKAVLTSLVELACMDSAHLLTGRGLRRGGYERGQGFRRLGP